MKLICAYHLSKRAHGRRLLDDVSLEVPQGAVCGVYGRNGAGKSLLFHCLFGLDKGFQGEVVAESKARPVMALQKPSLAPELTLAENLSFFASLGRVPRRRITGRVTQVLQELDLVSYRHIRTRFLPSGILAKAEIARVLAADSGLVMIDGLIDYLDKKSAESVWRVIQNRRRKDGQTFLITTTRADYAERCDFLSLMHEGRIIASGTPAELKAKAQADVVVVDSIRNPLIKSKIKKRFAAVVEEVGGALRFSSAEASSVLVDLLSEYGSEVGAVYVRQSNLEDLLNQLTGEDDFDV